MVAGHHTVHCPDAGQPIEALRDTENHKASRRKTYVDAGIMTIDEVRADMNLPPLG